MEIMKECKNVVTIMEISDESERDKKIRRNGDVLEGMKEREEKMLVEEEEELVRCWKRLEMYTKKRR